jgi:hypothetical protein
MATSKLPAQHHGEPATEAAAVTPADGADLAKGATEAWPRALYIGVSGDVCVDLLDAGSAIVFKSVPIGILPVRVKRVRSTSTTATNILAMY